MRRAAIALAVLLGGCLGPMPVGSPSPTSACHARGPLPDRVCTPGATNPVVTQGTIGTTICRAGWTATVRPPVSVTGPLKVRQMAAYGLTGPTAAYEEDHLIPLELGGAPADPLNLWPQPRAGSPGAADKDRFENYLHAEVCALRKPLSDAQVEIATDWVSAWIVAGRP